MYAASGPDPNTNLVSDAVNVVVPDPLVTTVGVRDFLFVNPDRMPATVQILAYLKVR